MRYAHMPNNKDKRALLHRLLASTLRRVPLRRPSTTSADPLPQHGRTETRGHNEQRTPVLPHDRSSHDHKIDLKIRIQRSPAQRQRNATIYTTLQIIGSLTAPPEHTCFERTGKPMPDAIVQQQSHLYLRVCADI